MDFFETAATRRSVRLFEPKKIEEQVMQKALDAALLAPNSSNMQPWEFYWIKSEDKKKLAVEACLNQSAARSSAEIVFAVARLDTWRRNQKLLLDIIKKDGKSPQSLIQYYEKIVPASYLYGPLNLIGFGKALIFNLVGIFRPMPRGPTTKSQVQEVVVKTTALACQNFMLAITAQGYASCPMEGFDESRIKKLLQLPRKTKVVMGIAVGVPSEMGIWGQQIRLDRDLFIKIV